MCPRAAAGYPSVTWWWEVPVGRGPNQCNPPLLCAGPPASKGFSGVGRHCKACASLPKLACLAPLTPIYAHLPSNTCLTFGLPISPSDLKAGISSLSSLGSCPYKYPCSFPHFSSTCAYSPSGQPPYPPAGLTLPAPLNVRGAMLTSALDLKQSEE